MPKIIQFLLLFISLNCFSQFEFKGEVNANFKNATAYLNLVQDFNKRNHFLTENIIKESKINQNGQFIFSGSLLDKKNKLYKIYIDNCNENINDSKHLLNQCNDNISLLFIANNTDQLFFPLNELSQMFCDLKFSKLNNVAVQKIDSLQETLLNTLQNTKNDVQRKNIYKNYFKKLQSFSKSLNEPLAELYAFYLYSDNQSFSREYYLEDLKTSIYYDELASKLNLKYPNSTYTNQFKNELITNNYKQLTLNKFNYFKYILSFALILSLLYNLFLYRKNKFLALNQKQQIKYQDVLTKQEQKVFELMNKNYSNKEIANKLFVSLSTIKTHINSIYRKLKIKSRKDIDFFLKN